MGGFPLDARLRAVGFSSDGRRLAVGCDDTIWVAEVGLPKRRRFASYDPDTARGDKDLLDTTTT